MSPGKRKKKGQLSPEDREIWSKVTKTLTPLHPERASMPDPDEISFTQAEPEPAKLPKKTATAMRAPQTKQPAPAPLPPLHTLEHRYRKKLVRGSKTIDARIDLHGLTQHQAHERLRGFLHSAQAQGHKVVLVITGKGGGNGRGFMDERGVLRRVVPQWLAMPDMRSVVIGYEEAHLSHGGAGALYVRIRRRR